MESEHRRQARELLFGPDVRHLAEHAPVSIAAAQAWATLAVADAMDRLASAVEALADQGQ
jgi:hypothetical protein